MFRGSGPLVRRGWFPMPPGPSKGPGEGRGKRSPRGAGRLEILLLISGARVLSLAPMIKISQPASPSRVAKSPKLRDWKSSGLL